MGSADLGLMNRLLDFWTDPVLPMAPEANRDFVRGVLETNRFYARTGEGIGRSLDGGYGLSQGSAQPWDAFSRGIQQMQQNFSESLS